MAWVDELIVSTNRIARIQRGGQAHLPLRARADAAAELCLRYRNLLLDPSFSRSIRDVLSPARAASPTTAARSGRAPRSDPFFQDMRCHINEAVALLVEAGADGEHALEAVRSVEQILLSPDPPAPVEPEELFRRLRDAKDAVCALRSELVSREEAEASRFSLRRAGLAGLGLALVGVTAGALAVVATPAAAVGGAVAAGVGAAAGAIGSTIFQHNTEGMKRH